jgi:hypothetical protein
MLINKSQTSDAKVMGKTKEARKHLQYLANKNIVGHEILTPLSVRNATLYSWRLTIRWNFTNTSGKLLFWIRK